MNTTTSENVSTVLSYMGGLRWAQGDNDTAVNHAALRAATLGVDSEFAFDEICRRVEASGGELRRDKVRHQIADAYRYAGTEAPGADNATLAACRSKPKWPHRADGLIVRVAGQYGGCADLWEASPIRLDENEHTEEIVDALFPENPWLCVGKTSSYFVTLERERLRGRLNKDFALIQPNPCKAQHGLTSDGRLSFHAETNVLERRYLIVEFDDANDWNDSDALDSQAARLLHLRLYLPLALVLFSGNKSLQGWFVCGNHSEDELKTFFTGAVKFGADRRLWLASQFCRMPDGWREWHDEKGERSLRLQSVYYFAPETLRAARV